MAFQLAFDRATHACVALARRVVKKPLPRAVLYHFAARSKPCDSNGRIKFLAGRLLLPQDLADVPAAQAARYLWIDGRVPTWINLHAWGADQEVFYIEIRTSGLLTVDDIALHEREGYPPFHVLVPLKPKG